MCFRQQLMMNAIREKMSELMRNEKKRLKGISPHIMAKKSSYWLFSLIGYSEGAAGFGAESVL
jgi:hypothetical protein